MNKYQEALNYLSVSLQVFDETVDDKTYRDELDAKREIARKALQELVDKATPKEPIIESQDYGYSYCYCPTCDANVGIETHLYTHNKYCHYCGQALDWSTDDE